MSDFPPRAPESVASEGSVAAAPDAYFSTMPTSSDRNSSAAAVAEGVAVGGRTTFAVAEILETARSSTLDDLGSLLETIAEARRQQQQEKQQKPTEAEAEEKAAVPPKQKPLPPPPLPRPRPRFVAVHPSCASHSVKAKKEEKEKGHRFRLLFRLPLRLPLSLPQLQLLLQSAVAVGVASCFVLVDALAFRQACTSVGFSLIIMLIGSSSSSVGSRLISCASFVLPLLLGAVGGGVAASLAREVAGVSVVAERFSSSTSDPSSSSYHARAKEPQFTVALVGFNLFVLALASAWR